MIEDREDHRTPRPRRREQQAAPVGILVDPEPRHDLDRLVLHSTVHEDIAAALRSIEMREQLEAVWKLSEIQPQAGRCILNFYGPPGTGKTRAALGIAWRLGKPLYQVDYSQIISKYLGDTAKHIAKAFKDAAESGVISGFASIPEVAWSTMPSLTSEVVWGRWGQVWGNHAGKMKVDFIRYGG